MRNLFSIALVSLLCGCVSFAKPDPETGRGGTSSMDPVVGSIAAVQAVFEMSSEFRLKGQILNLTNCSIPKPLKWLKVYVQKKDDPKQDIQLDIESEVFDYSLNLEKGKYIFSLYDERLGRTLDQVVRIVDGRDMRINFSDPCK
ncbi:MAG: hypothetical protein ACOH5I_17410 [Oligoflexus sp.]